MLSLWVDSYNEGDEGCGDIFIAPCPLWRLFSPHLQWSLVADLARWCLCDFEPVPVKLSLPHKAALWALYFTFEGRGLQVEIDSQDVGCTDSAPAPTPPSVAPRPDDPSIAALSGASLRDMLRQTAALIEAEGGDLTGAGLAVLPDAVTSIGRPARQRRSPASFQQLLLRALPDQGDPKVLHHALPSPLNRYRRLLLEAWLEHAADGGLGALGLPGRIFSRPGGEKRRLGISYADMTTGDCWVMLPLVTVRAINGLVDGDDGLLLGYLQETDAPRMRALLAVARDANASFEASWEKDKSCTSRAAAVVQLLSRAGSFSGDDVDPEIEREGEASEDSSKRTALDVSTGVERFRRALIEFSQRAVSATERPVWDCVCDKHSSHGVTAADVAVFSACGEVFGECLGVGVATTLSQRKLQRMLGEYHAAMEAMHGRAELSETQGRPSQLERAYGTPHLRLAAIRAIAHPAACVYLDLASPLESRQAAKRSLLSTVNSCSRCGAVCAVGGLSACSACKVARYCGRACQKADWPSHKPVCAALQAAAAKR